MRISGTGAAICGNGARGRPWRKSTNGCSGAGGLPKLSTILMVQTSMIPIVICLVGRAHRSLWVSGSFLGRGSSRSARAPRCWSGFSPSFPGFAFGRPGWRSPGLGLLAAVLVQPSVIFLVLESAVIGAVLTLSGLLIEA